MEDTNVDPGGATALEQLADVLWGQRHLVEYLLFKMITAKLLLGAGERRFMARSMEEIDRVVARLSEVEVRRAAALEPVARAWDVAPDDLTLARLSTDAPQPMATVFGDLHRAFLSLTSEIEQTAEDNRRLAGGQLDQLRSSLEGLTGPSVTTTYTARGTHDHIVTAPIRLDEVM